MDFLLPMLRSWLGLHVVRILAAPVGTPSVHEDQGPLDYVPLSEEQALAWCADPELDLDPQRVHAAYRRGDICVGATEAGVPVAYTWFAYAPAPHIQGMWVNFGGFARYVYKTFVRPSHRGRRIARELYRRASAICPARGRTLNVLMVDVDNDASARSAEGAGYVGIGYAGFLRGLAFRSPGAARCGFCFFRPEVVEHGRLTPKLQPYK
jgi:GNAT superfamily N-acetyltransferase